MSVNLRLNDDYYGAQMTGKKYINWSGGTAVVTVTEDSTVSDGEGVTVSVSVGTAVVGDGLGVSVTVGGWLRSKESIKVLDIE